MRQTLFWIPYEVGGVPLFGLGLLLALWAVFSVGLLVWLVRKQGWNADTLGYLPILALVAAAIALLPQIFDSALPIRGYGFMLLLGVVSGVLLAARRARQMGLNPELIFSMAFWLFVAGIAGARLFHVIEYWESDYKRSTVGTTLKAIINIPQGGLVFYGSLIGGFLAFVIFSLRHRLPVLAMADLIAPSLMLGLAFGRIGCLLNGCCFGGQCDLPWAVTFPAGSPPYQSQVYDGTLLGFRLADRELHRVEIVHVEPYSAAAAAQLTAGETLVRINGLPIDSAEKARMLIAQLLNDDRRIVLETSDGGTHALPSIEWPPRSRPVHPTQVYSAINAALICLFLLAYYPFRRRDGEVLALTLTIYPIARFLIEIIRTDEAAVFQTGLSISQNVSLLILLAVAGLWVYVLTQPRGSALPPSAAAG